MRFLRARLASGQVIVSRFEKLANVEKYVAQVFAGIKPFNVWVPVGERHPQSGEKVSLRTRRMFPARQIVEIEEVKPVSGRETDHNFEPSNFEPVVSMSRGERGIFTVPKEDERAPGLYGAQGDPLYTEGMREQGLVTGTQYPVHRDTTSYRDYIVTTAASEGQEEVRYYLDGHGAPQPMTVQAGVEDDGGWGDDDDQGDEDDDSF